VARWLALSLDRYAAPQSVTSTAAARRVLGAAQCGRYSLSAGRANAEPTTSRTGTDLGSVATPPQCGLYSTSRCVGGGVELT
jgi:hypothetical protein